ncbi:hypothetical protein GOV08_05645 [Candidatus Woesearchaeota archaeon]|nr:hypothetical protein [Candidatus Woesearchaeota archaeon]
MTKEKNIEEYFKYFEHRIKRERFDIVEPIFRKFTSRLFSEIRVEGIENLEGLNTLDDIGKEATNRLNANIILPRHLSLLDFILTPSELYIHNFYTTIQSGDNMFFGPFDNFWRELGAFMALRDEKTFDDGTIIKPRAGGRILRSYTEKEIVGKKENAMIYLEHLKVDGKTKSGRSYDGSLLEFMGFPIQTLLLAQENTGVPVIIFPVNNSYERVVETANYEKLIRINNKGWKNAKDYLLILKNAISPIYPKTETSIVFGEPYLLDPDKNRKDHTIKSREEVGKLSKIYDSQVFFRAIGEQRHISHTNLTDKINEVLDNVSRFSLESNLAPGLSRRYDSGGTEALIDRTCKVFKDSLMYFGGVFYITNSNVAMQSRNQISHLFDEAT